MKTIVGFGDTLMEQGLVTESRGFLARLAERYARRADVLARGYAGYTTREALKLVQPSVIANTPHSVLLAFGSSDSVRPDQFQHVPLDEYRANLESMANDIAYAGAWVIMITPPPFDERKTRSRTMEQTGQYALACYEVALEMNCPVIDLYHLLQQHPNWEERCLYDGLHFSATGMDILYDAIVNAYEKLLPLSECPRDGVDGL